MLLVVKNPPANGGDSDLWVGKIPWSRKWQFTPVFLPGNFHGQRTLAGWSPCAYKELDTIEQLNTHTRACTHTRTHICIVVWSLSHV